MDTFLERKTKVVVQLIIWKEVEVFSKIGWLRKTCKYYLKLYSSGKTKTKKLGEGVVLM